MRRQLVGAGAAVVVTAATVLVGGSSAVAKGGEVGGNGSEYFLSNSFSSTSDIDFKYGRANDQVYVGDWDGDGVDTLAVRRGNTFHVNNATTGGPAEHAFQYGRSADTVLVGDWDADSEDTFAVRRGSEYHVKNSLTGGSADVAVEYGRITDLVLVGDWDGDGEDTFTVRRGNDYHIANAIRGGGADRAVTYGRDTDTALAGDWNGDGVDTLGVRRASAGAAVGLESYDREMVEIINRYRVENGVAPLRHWSALRRGAIEHSQWMEETGRFEHASGNSISADSRAAGCRNGYAENIFWSDGYPADPEIAMENYMNSPGHRANILNPNLRFAATGTIYDDGELHNTQRFAVSCG